MSHCILRVSYSHNGLYRDYRVYIVPKLGVPTIMENQMEKTMENEMETGIM